MNPFAFIREKWVVFKGWRKMRRLVGDTEALTGLRRNDAVRVATKELVEKTLANMAAIDFDIVSMDRVIQHKLGDRSVELDDAERSFANSRVGELACVMGLAKEAFLTERMLEHYAWTGYQALGIEVHPLLGCVRTTYKGGIIRPEDIDQEALMLYLRRCGAKEYRLFSERAWRAATSESHFFARHPDVSNYWFTVLMESLDTNRLRVVESMTDPTHKNAAPHKKREAIEAFLSELHEEKAKAA